MSAGLFVVDFGEFPLVTFTYRKSVSDDVMAQVVKQMDDLFVRRRPYASVVDCRGGEMPPAKQRRMITDWQRPNETNLRTYCRGIAFIFDSAALRMGLNAVFWMANTPYEFGCFNTLSEARSFAMQRVGLATPEPVRASRP